MKKFTLLLLFLFICISGYSQLALEGFESTTGPDALPSTNWTLGTGNWAVFDNGVGTNVRWDINSTVATPPIVFQGANAAYANRENIGAGNTSEDYLATPDVVIPSNGVLHFYTRMFTSGNQGTIYQIKLAPAGSQTNPSSYSLVQQWTEDELIVPTSNFNIYTEKTVDLSAFAGLTVNVAFVRVFTQPDGNLGGDRWLVDNVSIDSPCLTPTALTSGTLTSNSATVSWTNPNGTVNGWEIEVIPATGTPTGVANYTTTSFPYVITGLLPNTTYKYYVRAICTTGFSSPWSVASANFTTLVAPPVCGGNFVDSGGVSANYANNANVTTNICPTNPGDLVTVTFTSFNTENGVDLLKVYDGNDATAPLLATLSGTALPPAYTASSASGCLTFVFTSNATTTAAGWASNVTCGPPPACRVPTSVTASGITVNSATINWTQPANPDSSVASVFDIIVLPANSAAPSASSVPTYNDVSAATGPSFNITGLASGTCYDVYVRAVCATDSGWSLVGARVCTLVAPPVCGGNYVDSGGTGADYSNNATLTTVICPSATTDAVTVAFTSFNLAAGDTMAIYDGDTTGATLLGTYTGTALPPTYTSTAPSGCLTFQFISNATGTAPGWLANVTCAPKAACTPPITLTNNTVLHNSAVLNWVQQANPDSSVSSSWDVYVVACGSPAPTAGTIPTVTVTSAPPYTLTGLSPVTCYNVYVRSSCGSTWTGPTVFTTLAAPPQCGGNYVDNGGTTANYLPNSNVTTVICPTNPGDVVTVTFTSYDTEATWDGIYVYNGNSVASPQIASNNPIGNGPMTTPGAYWGTTIPCPFTSSDASGCLTFVFRSDGSVQRAGFIANITCAPPSTCAAPTALAASTVTHNSAVLNWTQPANPDSSVATAWDVYYVACGGAAPTASTVPSATVTTAPPYTLTGLTPLTCYDIYVRANCGTSTSVWPCTPITITTAPTPPVCGGTFVDAGGPAANYGANSNQTTTICPTNPGDVVTVTFTSFNTEANNDALYVYNGNSVVPANLITSGNGAGGVPGGIAGGYWGTTIPCSFTSASSDGCLTFVFRSNATVQNAGWVANVTCAPPVACSMPTSLTSNTVTHNSAVINWTQPANPDSSVATAWDLYYVACGSPAPTAATVPSATVTTAPPYTLTGLSPTTCYNVYVRANCGTSTSAWTCSPTTFTTLIAPPECGGTYVDVGGTTANYPNSSDSTVIICPNNPGDIVTVTFTSFYTEANWDGLLVYDGNSIASPQIASANGTGNGVFTTITGAYWGNLTGANLPGPFMSSASNGCLTFHFLSDASVNNPGWVANVTCAPAPECQRPNTLTATQITSTSAYLGWTEPSGNVTQWQVLVLPLGSPAPLPDATGWVTVSTNPALFTGLTAGTRYTYYVRGVCATSGTSAWSVGFNFTTLIINDNCDGAVFVPVNSDAVCQQIGHGTLAGATASTPAIAAPCVGSADDDVWFQFIATNSYLNVSLQNIVGSTTNLNFAAYSGNCGTLNQIFCSAANSLSGVLNGLVVGNTYYIRVYSNASTPQTSTFDICISTPSTCTNSSSVCSVTGLAYGNTTGVTSLGTIGCLFTSPNPTFFTIQIVNSGPVNYLLTQSTTPGGAPNLDVDYAAWGPFNSQAEVCNVIGSGQAPLTGLTTGCSYSAAATENFNIPNAVAGQFYVILITNFSNNTGYISLTQTNAATPGSGLTLCCPDADFHYASSTYCKDPTIHPIPTIENGSVAGVFSLLPSTPTGLVFANTATGEIDLQASAPGNYIVQNTVAANGSCSVKTSTFTISIVAPAVATIAYDATFYCQNISTLQSVTQTGATGGSYSATPNGGLYINVNSGAINPSLSSPGIYTVSYSLPGSSICVGSNPSFQVEIGAKPTIIQPDPVIACDSYMLPALAVGNYFDGPDGTGNQLNAGDILTTVGTQTLYIYAVSNMGCTSEKSFTVTINKVATPTYTTTQSACAASTGTITVTTPVSPGATPAADLFISEVTDANTGSLTYVEIFNGTGVAVNLSNYKIRTFNNGSTTFSSGCDNILSGTLNNNSTYVISVGSATNAGGVVPNQVFAGCGGVNTDDCIKLMSSTNTVIDLWGRTDGVAFTPLSQPGYTYRRLTTATVPSTTWNAADWNAIDPEDYTNVGQYAYPTTSNYQYSLDNGTYQTSPTFTNLAPGPHILIVKDVATGCFSAPVTVTIDATNATPSVTTFTYATPVCINATTNPIPDTSATGFTSGGTWTASPSGTIDINPTTGEINLAGTTAGPYDITYTYAFNPTTCQSYSSTTFTINITNTITPVLGFSYTTPICKDAQTTLSPTLDSGFTTGGTFSSTTGLTIDGTTGDIDLTTSTAGPYTITYTVPATSCQTASSATFDIVIKPTITPVTTFSYITPLCQNSTTNPIPNTSATGFTTGGTFTSNPSTGIDLNPTTGEINLATTTANTYVITYTTLADPANCQPAGSTDFTIVINPIVNPVLGFSYTTPICKNAQATLSPTLATGFTTGGTFSSTTGLVINGATGVIDLAASTAGSYTITYVSNANATTCLVGGSNTADIVINPVITPVTGFSYSTPFCSTDTVSLQSPILGAGFTTGGTFSSTTGLTIDGTSGEIDVQTSTPGVYTITYAIGADPAICQVAGTSSTQIMIIAPVTIELVGGCQSANYVLTATPVNGSFVPETATYLWHNAQGVQVGNTQSITVTEVGVYTVTVTVDGCSTESLPFDVTSVFCVIQKGISVNNDGVNDTFDLTGFNVKKLTIFNRLGMKVYSRNNYINEWGGKSDAGDELPDGTYYFIIERNTGDTKTGWIYINRAQ